MAIGDDAAAQGWALVNSTTGLVKDGGQEINRTRDYAAQVKVLILTVWPITRGGTGATTAAAARTNLGLGTVATESIVPLAKGGTAGTTKPTARTGLGISSGTAVPANSSGADGDIFFKTL